MRINRRIVDDFLSGKDICEEWIFSEIEEGKHLFCLSDVQTKQSEIKELADRISQMTEHFEPCNAAYYRSLFPEFEQQLRDYEVMLTVGLPSPYDAMVTEHNGTERIVFDMGRFLSYPTKQPTHFCTKDGIRIKPLLIGSSCNFSALTRDLPICLPAERNCPILMPCPGCGSIKILPCFSCKKRLPARTLANRNNG